MANLITPDCIFSALTIFWFTNVLWQLFYPTIKRVIVISLLIVLNSLFDYSALWLIIPSVFVVYHSHFRFSNKLKGWCLFISIPLLFIIFCLGYNKEKYSVDTFSSIGGWHLGSSALFVYNYIPEINSDSLPVEFKKFTEIVNYHRDSLNGLMIRPDFVPNEYYLTNDASPLRVYYRYQQSRDSIKIFFKQYNDVGNFYRRFGGYIISRYPKAFLQHFIWPNIMFFYAPRAEAFINYNRDVDTVEYEIADWFRYKNNRVNFRYHTWRIPFMHIRVPLFFALVKTIFLTVTLLTFLLPSTEVGKSKTFKFIVLILWVFITNIILSIIIGANSIRTQVFITTVLLFYDVFILSLFFNKNIDNHKNDEIC